MIKDPNENLGSSKPIEMPKPIDANLTIIELLNKVLVNQAILFHRIDELYHGQTKPVNRSFYDVEKAKEELDKIAKTFNT